MKQKSVSDIGTVLIIVVTADKQQPATLEVHMEEQSGSDL